MEMSPDYKRYKLEADGISTRTLPGTGNYFIANSDEHDEQGFSSEEIEDRNHQMEKRMKKLDMCAATDMQQPTLYGPKDADVTIVSWGSNKGSILQAMKDLPNVNYLHITWLSPFPTQTVKDILEKSKHVINVECNYTAQMAGLIREKTGIDIQDKYLKYDGRPIYPEEIVEKVTSVLKSMPPSRVLNGKAQAESAQIGG
jgi:2-oxoglutarate ferredoxin oxidoreductase subunit alpha